MRVSEGLEGIGALSSLSGERWSYFYQWYRRQYYGLWVFMVKVRNREAPEQWQFKKAFSNTTLDAFSLHQV